MTYNIIKSTNMVEKYLYANLYLPQPKIELGAGGKHLFFWNLLLKV